MDELIAFLKARLDEEGQVARHAHAYDSEAEAEDFGPTTYQVALWAKAEPPVRAFVDGMSPARVLRDIEADRKLIAAYERADAKAQFPNLEGGIAEGLEIALRIRVARFDDHADYRQDW